jgi:putative flippase GtrA
MNYSLKLDRFLRLKIIKFLSAGALNTIFGYSIYAALIFIKIPYLFALLAATIAGIIFNFFTFGRLVFHGRGFGFVFGKFFIAYVLIYGINAALLSILTINLLLSPYIGQALCIPISVLLSWLLMNYWVYKNV